MQEFESGLNECKKLINSGDIKGAITRMDTYGREVSIGIGSGLLRISEAIKRLNQINNDILHYLKDNDEKRALRDIEASREKLKIIQGLIEEYVEKVLN